MEAMNKNCNTSSTDKNDEILVVIVGAGGLASELQEAALAMSDMGLPIRCIAFFVEHGFAKPTLSDFPIWDDWTKLTSSKARVVVGIGDIVSRKRVAELVSGNIGDDRFVSVIHPMAQRGRSVCIKAGSMLLGQMSLTARIEIGQHVLINPGCTIAHDCRVGDFSNLSPSVSLAGNVKIGRECFLGTGAIVGPGITIGDGAVIGAGAVVLQDVADGQKVFGVPAKPPRC
ncbi:sugar o-acyltransferase, sialic acid o-acetyltransferase neud family protein [Ochrobactrum sp. CDB2]|nr:sugar o-acyltransferase, sialic acid o-acetyltransferase neud family protein [Ochrobactrum sp. CDB2]